MMRPPRPNGTPPSCASPRSRSRRWPLRLPSVAKPMSVAFGRDELPALVRDGRALFEHRRGMDPGGRLLDLPGLNHFTIYRELSHPDWALVQEALRLASHVIGSG